LFHLSGVQPDAFLAVIRRVIGDPIDHSDADMSADAVSARSGSYPITAGVPNMLVPDRVLTDTYGPRYLKAWKIVQEAGEAAYAKGPEGNFSVDAWHPATECGQLLRSLIGDNNLVLDVGCGLLPLPAYMSASGQQSFVGIDPMRGTAPRLFPFVQSYGDFLPFRAGAFDAVQFISSLDHMLHPGKALRDAFAVVRKGGALLVEETIRPWNKHLLKWRLKSMVRPTRFNTFHNYAFTQESLVRQIRAAGFREVRVVPTSEANEICVTARRLD
jgi:SAM-dependent methyltransferase